MQRVYIDVIAEITPEGEIFPKRLRSEDGVVYAVARRLERPRICFDEAGSTLRRFPCLVGNRRVVLFCDEETRRWFTYRPDGPAA